MRRVLARLLFQIDEFLPCGVRGGGLRTEYTWQKLKWLNELSTFVFCEKSKFFSATKKMGVKSVKTHVIIILENNMPKMLL